PVWAQFLILGTIVNAIFSSADLVCVGLAGAVVTRLQRSNAAQRLMQRAGGAALVGLGVHLALQKN
ncbi:LysE family translocator, partial [Rhizobiaceae sp. 2RAB30]